MDTVLNDRYRLVAMLGRGGMGEVWHAVDLTLGRPVAVKVIRGGDAPDHSIQIQLLERFKREARAIAALSHPNIVTAFDFGVDESSMIQYLVMELIDGQSVASEMAARLDAGRGGMSVRDACAIGIDVCAGLAAAHRLGVVHRDLKPENLMRDRRTGQLKIVDFGIALSADVSRITRDGGWLGSLPYIAPEQLAGESGPRSDVYALGCVLFELLTGRSAYDASEPAQYMVAHFRGTPHRLREFEPSAPVELEALLVEMLAKDPADRPDADTVARRLGELVRTPDPARVATIPDAAPPTYIAPPTDIPPPSASRGRRWIVPVAVPSAILVIVAVALVWPGSPGTHGTTGPSKSPGANALPASASAAPCGLRLAFLGAFTHATLPTAASVKRGAALAVHEYNATHGADCVHLVDYDTRVDQATTVTAATTIANDTTNVGVIGGVFTPEVLASAPVFEKAGLPFISPTATNPTLSHSGWSTFHRAIPNDDDIPPAIARYVTEVQHATRVYVVGDTTTYGQGLADSAGARLGGLVIGRSRLPSDAGAGAYGDVADLVVAAHADTLVFGGQAGAAVKLRRALTARGWSGVLVGGAAILGDSYQRGLAAPGAGTVAVSWYSPAPTSGAFYDAYRAFYGTPPGLFADLGYDAATAFLRGLATGHGSRAGMLAWLSGYQGAGVVRSYRFTATGELDPAVSGEWVYRSDGTRFSPVGPAPTS